MITPIMCFIFSLSLLLFPPCIAHDTRCGHPAIAPLDVTGYARFPQGTDGLRLGSFPSQVAPVFENAIFNPMVVANRKHPHNFLIVCNQGYNLSYLVNLALFSRDQGTTWNQSDLITSRIQGATLAGAPNDFVSPTAPYAASQRLGNFHLGYAARQLINPDGSSNFANALNYTKSTNRGISWNALASIQNNLYPAQVAFVDRPTITVNPYNPTTLYAVWGNLLQLLDPAAAQTLELQISPDGGNTWSAPTTVATLDSGVYGFNAILHILPNKRPVIIYQANSPDGTFNIIALTSKDFVYWHQHIAYKNGIIAVVTDPNAPNLTYSTYMFGADSKVHPKTGELYITWADGKANPAWSPQSPMSGVFISRSKDGGISWSSPIVANPKTVGIQTFSPSIAITENCVVGVCFYDFRRYQDEGSFTASLKTNLWLTLFDHSIEKFLGEVRLTPESFDARKFTFFPNQGFLISDVGTIDAIHNEFLIAYPTTNPPYGGGPIVIPNGTAFTGLPVTCTFFRVPINSPCSKHCVKPFLKDSLHVPNESGAQALKNYLARLAKAFSLPLTK